MSLARSLVLLLALSIPAVIAGCAQAPTAPAAKDSTQLGSASTDTTVTRLCGHTQGWGC